MKTAKRPATTASTTTASTASEDNPGDVRERVLATASDLFYREGVRAVGVDLIVERAGVAKTSLYRHFRTKDDLIAAFLEREDKDFWSDWDSVALRHAKDPAAELKAHLKWIGERIARPNYRGCPQLNVAAEFPAPDHPARLVATAHKTELRRRLKKIAEGIGVRHPQRLASQLALVIDGAFMSGRLLEKESATLVLQSTARALIAGANADAKD